MAKNLLVRNAIRLLENKTLNALASELDTSVAFDWKSSPLKALNGKTTGLVVFSFNDEYTTIWHGTVSYNWDTLLIEISTETYNGTINRRFAY